MFQTLPNLFRGNEFGSRCINIYGRFFQVEINLQQRNLNQSLNQQTKPKKVQL